MNAAQYFSASGVARSRGTPMPRLVRILYLITLLAIVHMYRKYHRWYSWYTICLHYALRVAPKTKRTKKAFRKCLGSFVFVYQRARSYEERMHALPVAGGRFLKPS